MSKSRQKTPIAGVTTARSEKQWKRMVNRKFRHRVKQHLAKRSQVFPEKLNEVVNIWDGPKDGRCRWGWDWGWQSYWKMWRGKAWRREKRVRNAISPKHWESFTKEAHPNRQDALMEG